jgi:hypothetical protein
MAQGQCMRRHVPTAERNVKSPLNPFLENLELFIRSGARTIDWKFHFSVEIFQRIFECFLILR